jgi:AraC-like DNA-binding protein
MMECINGHTFCCDEALERPSKKELIKMILENEWNKDAWDSGIKDSRDFSEEELLVMEEDDLFDKFCSEGGYYEVPECVCPICQFIEYSEYDLSAYLLKEYGVSRDEVFVEVKKLNKRRRKLYENEYITYVCKKFDLNPTEIVAAWKEKFGTYNKFREWLEN